VEKDRFNYLVHQYNSLTPEETAELRLEQDHYGYCQVLHQLIARGDQDNQTEMKEHSLNIAAVYSTDRAVLKRIMTEPRSERSASSSPPVVDAELSKAVESTSNIVTPPTVVAQKEEPKAVYTPPAVSDFDSDAAVSRFVAELGPMREKKMQFEKAIEEFERNFNKAPSQRDANGTAEVEIEGEKPKRKYIKQSARPSVTQPATNTSEQLLEDIKTTKKKIAPESSKQKEQIEIIDHFINTKPTLSKPSGEQTELDLTEETETYNENVVSETLALILIRQGKKEKAIEVLRKLIWKFPQKKAYFAAQIEELSK
jgi:tetratricopeptide (TPR) repeat protein